MTEIEELKRKLQTARAALEEIRCIVEYDSQRHGGTMVYDMITESAAKGLEGPSEQRNPSFATAAGA